MDDQPPPLTELQSPREELAELAAAVDEIRLLMRVLVVLAIGIFVVVLIAGILAATTAGHVQQQLGIN